MLYILHTYIYYMFLFIYTHTHTHARTDIHKCSMSCSCFLWWIWNYRKNQNSVVVGEASVPTLLNEATSQLVLMRSQGFNPGPISSVRAAMPTTQFIHIEVIAIHNPFQAAWDSVSGDSEWRDRLWNQDLHQGQYSLCSYVNLIPRADTWFGRPRRQDRGNSLYVPSFTSFWNPIESGQKSGGFKKKSGGCWWKKSIWLRHLQGCIHQGFFLMQRPSTYWLQKIKGKLLV